MAFFNKIIKEEPSHSINIKEGLEKEVDFFTSINTIAEETRIYSNLKKEKITAVNNLLVNGITREYERVYIPEFGKISKVKLNNFEGLVKEKERLDNTFSDKRFKLLAKECIYNRKYVYYPPFSTIIIQKSLLERFREAYDFKYDGEKAALLMKEMADNVSLLDPKEYDPLNYTFKNFIDKALPKEEEIDLECKRKIFGEDNLEDEDKKFDPDNFIESMASVFFNFKYKDTDDALELEDITEEDFAKALSYLESADLLDKLATFKPAWSLKPIFSNLERNIYFTNISDEKLDMLFKLMTYALKAYSVKLELVSEFYSLCITIVETVVNHNRKMMEVEMDNRIRNSRSTNTPEDEKINNKGDF